MTGMFPEGWNTTPDVVEDEAGWLEIYYTEMRMKETDITLELLWDMDVRRKRDRNTYGVA
jgi:hypothetical protein